MFNLNNPRGFEEVQKNETGLPGINRHAKESKLKEWKVNGKAATAAAIHGKSLARQGSRLRSRNCSALSGCFDETLICYAAIKLF
jgi:hypothetical protein